MHQCCSASMPWLIPESNSHEWDWHNNEILPQLKILLNFFVFDRRAADEGLLTLIIWIEFLMFGSFILFILLLLLPWQHHTVAIGSLLKDCNPCKCEQKQCIPLSIQLKSDLALFNEGFSNWIEEVYVSQHKWNSFTCFRCQFEECNTDLYLLYPPIQIQMKQNWTELQRERIIKCKCYLSHFDK